MVNHTTPCFREWLAALCAAITSVNDVLAALLPIVTICLVVFFPEIPSGR
jgi:hypothetical protein